MKSVIIKIVGLALVGYLIYTLWVLISYDAGNPYGKKELDEESRERIRQIQGKVESEKDTRSILDRVAEGDSGEKPITAEEAASMAQHHLAQVCADQSLDFNVFADVEVLESEEFMWLFKYSSSDPKTNDYFVAIDKYGRIKSAKDLGSIR